MTKTVTIAATRAGGEPYAHHDVIVTLVAGSAGGVVGSNVIVEQSTVKLDADGEGSIVLRTNDVEITSPSTSFYRFTVADSSPTITRSIALTDDLPSTVSWTLAGIQVGDPTIPQRDVSATYVTMPDGTGLPNYLAGLAAVTTADLILSTDAVDGTGTTFSVLVPFAADGGFIVRGTLDASSFAGFLGSEFPDGATVAVPYGDHPGVYSITAANVDSPWTSVATPLAATVAGTYTFDWLAAVVPGEPMRTLYPSPEVRDLRLTTPPPLVDSGKWLLTKGDGTSYASCPVPGPLTGLDVRFSVAARAPMPEPGTPGEKKYLEFFTIPHPDFADLDLIEVALEWDQDGGLLGHFGEFHRGGDPVVGHGEYDDGRIQTGDSEFRLPVGHAWRGRYTVDPDAGVIAFWVEMLDIGDVTTADGRHWRRVARKQVAPFAMSEQIDAGKTIEVGIHDGLLAVGELEIRDGIDGDLWANLPLTGTTDGAGNTWAFHGDAAVVDASLGAGGSGGVALGESSTTAYRGDRGKTAYDHSQLVTGNPHGTTAADVGAAATSHNHAASEVNSGTLDIARIPTGTTGSTVPFGNDSRFSDTRTPTDASVTTAKLDATLTAAVGRIPTVVATATSDTAVSSTTLTNDAGLVAAVGVGTYHYRAVLWVTGDTAGDLDTAVTTPTNSVYFASTRGLSNAASAQPNSPNDVTVTSSGTRMTGFGTVTAGPVRVTIEGTVTTTASGNIQIQHSQRTTNGTATTVKAGSNLTVWHG